MNVLCKIDVPANICIHQEQVCRLVCDKDRKRYGSEQAFRMICKN